MCNLFNDAFSSLDYIASNVSMMRERGIVKDVEGSGRGLILWCYTGFCLKGLQKTTKTG
jgi:hypothetical protein